MNHKEIYKSYLLAIRKACLEADVPFWAVVIMPNKEEEATKEERLFVYHMPYTKITERFLVRAMIARDFLNNAKMLKPFADAASLLPQLSFSVSDDQADKIIRTMESLADYLHIQGHNAHFFGEALLRSGDTKVGSCFSVRSGSVLTPTALLLLYLTKYSDKERSYSQDNLVTILANANEEELSAFYEILYEEIKLKIDENNPINNSLNISKFNQEVDNG